MVMKSLFGEKCFRCEKKRTKQEVDGLPTCDDCEVAINAEREDFRDCPACDTTMAKLIVQKVVTDKCPACGGVWLDAGELDLIQQASKAEGGGDFATGMVIGMAMG